MKYSHALLTSLLEDEEVMKTKLMEVVSNIQSLDKVIEALRQDGLVQKTERIVGRRTIYISLTPLGRSVARQLRRADEAAMGRKLSTPGALEIISELNRQGQMILSDLRVEHPDAIEIVDELESLGVLSKSIDKDRKPAEVVVRLTKQGKEIAKMLKQIYEMLQWET